MGKSYFGCRIHFKDGSTDKVFYQKTIEESDAFFADMVKQSKGVLKMLKTANSVGETAIEDSGYYENDYVVISKEDVEFPE